MAITERHWEVPEFEEDDELDPFSFDDLEYSWDEDDIFDLLDDSADYAEIIGDRELDFDYDYDMNDYPYGFGKD